MVVVVVDPDAIVQKLSVYPHAYSPADVKANAEPFDPALITFPVATSDIIGLGSVKHSDAYDWLTCVPFPYVPAPLYPDAYTVFVAPW